MSLKSCSHGISYDDECIKCEILWWEDSVRRAKMYLDRAERKLAAAKKKLARKS